MLLGGFMCMTTPAKITAIMITETSAVESEEIRERWLESSIKVIKGMRGEGVPVIGYTWFPLFTMIDWRYRFSEAPLEDFYLELGLYRINREQAKPRWLATPLVEMFRNLASDPQASVGDLAAPPRRHQASEMPLATVESF